MDRTGIDLPNLWIDERGMWRAALRGIEGFGETEDDAIADMERETRKLDRENNKRERAG